MNQLIIDGVLLLLLSVAIGSFFVLNRRISALRSAQSEMASLIGKLTRATEQAQNSIFALKAAAAEAEDGLKSSIAGAKSLSDELAMITEAGDNLANRLEQQFSERPGKASGSIIPLKRMVEEPDPEIFGAIKNAR